MDAAAERDLPRPRAIDTPQDELTRTWTDPPGFLGIFATVQNNPIAYRYMGTAFAFFIIGGFQALLMRTQLAVPANDFVTPDAYNKLFTMHGSTMMFLFVVPFLEAVAIALLPSMLGNRDMPFPRLTALGYWTFLFGGLLMYSSFLFGLAPDGGWFAYVPLTGPVYSPGLNIDFWTIGLGLAEVAAIGGAIELIVGILKMRAPGLSVNRIPVFAWAILVMAFMMVAGFTPLLVGDTFLEADRKLGTHFFNPAAGGDPLLWQHLFWIFGHPEVYIQFIPAAGIVSMVVPVFARRALVGYHWVVLALVAIGFLSFGLWVHHMFATGLSLTALGFFSAASNAIAIASGIQFFAWLATMWRARIVLASPMLFVLGFLIIFLIGGITGVMVASVPFNWQVHDSYFVVAHLHYVLIGGVVFPIFAGLHYWFGLWTGKLLSERIARWTFGLMFVGFNLAFFPMHISGLLGMPRRVYTYAPGMGLELYNVFSSIGALIFAIGVGTFLVNVIASFQSGRDTGDNPWGAGTLEWGTGVPAPAFSFRTLPIVRSREPLWDQDDLHRGDEGTERIIRGLGQTPTTWRAALITTAFDSVPQSIQRMAGPSYMPFTLAVGLLILSIGTLIDAYLLIGAGLLISFAAAIGWLWPDRGERETSDEAAELHGLPIHVTGTAAVGWWAMLSVILVFATVIASLGFSYHYLRAGAAEWPPAGSPRPGVVLPIISGILTIVAAGAVLWADRAAKRAGWSTVRLGLSLGLIAGIGALAVQIVDFLTAGVTPQSNAYGSAFFFTAGFHAFQVGIGIIILLFTLAQALFGFFSQRRRLAIQNSALYWGYSAVGWLMLFLIAYVSPWVL